MISGNQIFLRAVQAQDLQNWLKWFNDPETTRYLAVVYPYGLAEAEAYWQRIQKNAGQEVLYSIVSQEKEQHIGSISLRRIDWRSRNAELAIVLGASEFCGKGYGRDAVYSLCRFAFEEMGLHRIYLYVCSDHESGIETYRRVGFQQEGIARQQLLRKGRYHDLILMGLLADELTD